MKNNLWLLLSGLLLLTVPALAQSKTDAKQHRIVFHLATGDTLAYRALTKQLNNVLAYWPTALLEVVVHNKGIGFMRRDESLFEPEIQALKSKGVVFAVCENTMKQQKLTKDQILPQAIFVPVGLAELVIRQEEGWSYIKAGF
jgi:intracellular sulfur oxidation DsrE/DsrF family protein